MSIGSALTKFQTHYVARVSQGTQQILHTSRYTTSNLSLSSFPYKNTGIDMRFPQEPITQIPLETIVHNMNKLEALRVLQSNTYSIHDKEKIAKQVMYDEIDPCLAMYLRSGGLMDGSDFDADDFA